MFTEKQIEDLKERLVALSDNYNTEIAKKVNMSRATVVRFFDGSNNQSRKETAKAIFDAALVFVEEEERKQKLRMKKARRLIYGEQEDQEEPSGNAAQGRLNLNS